MEEEFAILGIEADDVVGKDVSREIRRELQHVLRRLPGELARDSV